MFFTISSIKIHDQLQLHYAIYIMNKYILTVILESIYHLRPGGGGLM